MKKNTSLFLVIFLMFSCESPIQDYLEQEDKKVQTTSEVDNLLLSDTIKTISLSDAEKVAILYDYNKGGVSTRTNKDVQIRNAFSICDSINSPIMYVVNYEKGFVIISAKKNLLPILAYSEEGYIDEKNIDLPVSWIRLIKDSQDRNKLAVKSAEWVPYEKSHLFSGKVASTRSFSIEDWQYETINDIDVGRIGQENRLKDAVAPGTNVSEYYLDSKEVITLEEAVERGYQIDNLIDIQNYLFEKSHSVIFEDLYMPFVYVRNYSTQTKQMGPVLQTRWHQQFPYNRYCPEFDANDPYHNPAGCIPVAIAQVMNYFKYPSDYVDWGKIESEERGLEMNKTEAPQLIKKIGSSIKMTYKYDKAYPAIFINFIKGKWGNKGSNMIVDFFKGRGYDVQRSEKYCFFSYNDFPVYMQGTAEGTDFLGLIQLPSLDGHAFVCDGEKNYHYCSTYQVFMARGGDKYPANNPFVKIVDGYVGASTTSHIHVELGWPSSSSRAWVYTARVLGNYPLQYLEDYFSSIIVKKK